MKTIDVKSSSIKKAKYDEKNNTMEVLFNRGVWWKIMQVTRYDWSDFLNADSKGSFVHTLMLYKPNHAA